MKKEYERTLLHNKYRFYVNIQNMQTGIETDYV